jgi:hypothetical protein
MNGLAVVEIDLVAAQVGGLPAVLERRLSHDRFLQRGGQEVGRYVPQGPVLPGTARLQLAEHGGVEIDGGTPHDACC